MSIEESIFKKITINFDKILEYGFEKKEDKYIFSKLILDDTFKVIIEIDNLNKINGKIIELSLNEEYTNFRIDNVTGEFVNKIKNEFVEILEDIKSNCCTQNNYISKQANRINDLIIKEYNSKPEFLWTKYPNYGVYRNSNTDKWYAIIMNISKNKIDKGNEEIEIINLKLKEDKIIKLLSKNGFYKAYHMNKKYWITIILDDTLDDQEIMEYIKESYSLSN